MRLRRSTVAIGTSLTAILAAGCASTQSPGTAAANEGQRAVVVTAEGRTVYANDLGAAGQSVRVHDRPLAVMSALTQVYTDLQIPIGTMSTSSGQVGNTNLRVPSHVIGGQPLSAYLSCGQGSSLNGNLADLGQVTISVLSTIVADGDSGSVVKTEVGGRAHSVGQSTDQIQCESNGQLEKRINVRLMVVMASGARPAN